MPPKSKKELIKIWNQVPPDYYQKGVSENRLQRYWHNTKVRSFQKLVGTPKFKFNKILDVGCASGRMTNELSRLMPNANFYAVDIYPKAVKFGKKIYPHIHFKVANAEKLPFKKNSFDLILSYETIEHVVNPSRMLLEMKRVVKKKVLLLLPWTREASFSDSSGGFGKKPKVEFGKTPTFTPINIMNSKT